MLRISIVGVALAVALGTSVSAQKPDDGQIRDRQRVSIFEGTLERAVTSGADSLLRQVRAVSPDVPMLTGVPEVRGVRLDGYGIFFDVEVPALRMPVTWPLRYMVRSDNRDLENLAAELKTVIAGVDPRYREQLIQVVRRIESRTQGSVTMRGPTGTVTATQLDLALSPVTAAVADPGLIDNPEAGYTREVKKSLIDAMIEYSGPLALGAEEWLTVAARDNLPRDPLVRGDTADFSTVVFRVKGRDLAAFHSGRSTLEEARQKVEVKEY